MISGTLAQDLISTTRSRTSKLRISFDSNTMTSTATVSEVINDTQNKRFFFDAIATFDTTGHTGEIIALVEILDNADNAIIRESTNIEITQAETEIKYTVYMYYDF